MSNNGKAIVLGGAGDVGEGIVRQLRAGEWSVIVPSRSVDKLDYLEISTEGPGAFHPYRAEIGSAEGAREAARDISRQHRDIDLVVASIGGWWSGADLLGIEVDDWYRVLEGSLSSHFHAARAFLPLLMTGSKGQYAFINGGAALMPVPGSGPISISAAAQVMLQRVLASETAGDDVNIYSLILNSLIVTRSRKKAPDGSLTADQVGQKILNLYTDRPASGEAIIFSSADEL